MRNTLNLIPYLLLSLVLVAGPMACADSPRRGGPSGGGGDGSDNGGGEGGGEEGEGEGGEEGEGEGPAPCPEGEQRDIDGGCVPIDIPGCRTRCDCNPPLVCDPNADEGLGECIASLPTCNGNSDCQCGQICDLGACVDGCNNNDDCGRGRSCAELGNGKNGCFDACTEEAGCPSEEFACEEGSCIPVVRKCAGCVDDTECGSTVDRCTDFGAIGSFCTKNCSDDPNACGEGFRCVDVNRELGGGQVEVHRQCVPLVGDCTTACAFIGCEDPDNPFCNVLTGRCEAEFGSCDPCQQHEQCGEGSSCLSWRRDDEKFCFRECPNGARDCGDESRWRCDSQGRVPLCVPLSGTCDRCVNSACGLLSPHCHPSTGECVECLADRDCGSGQVCGLNSNLCISTGLACSTGAEVPGEEEDPEADPEDDPGVQLCVPEAPYCYEGNCVQCLGSFDCRCPAENPDCNPVCYRFQCKGDDFCQPDPCPNGTQCITEARRCVPGGLCQTDAECNDQSRLCDVERQVCYNADGRCYHNGDCPSNLVCNLNSNLCEGCVDDTMCRGRQRCVGGACTQG